MGKKIKRVVNISETGVWENEVEHCFDSSLCTELINFFDKKGIKNNKDKKICDLGCGCKGYYTKEFLKNNINCYGFDGNPETEKASQGICKVRDLTIPYNDVYDWVMCLEVAEHIPKKFEKIFIENLHNNNNKGIILSWAVIGQKGSGHVNCQNNDYVKELFKNLGYKNDIKAENILREKSSLNWFKKTIMVFTK